MNHPTPEAAIIDPHPGLVGWWRFDEGTGNNAADSSGNGNIGTIHGATWVPGKYGQALSFDGVNDYVEVLDSASLDISIATTLEAWIYPTSFTFGSYNEGGIITKDSAYRLLLQGNTFASRWKTSSVSWASGARIGPVLPSINNWDHLAVTYDSTLGKVKFYLNGVYYAEKDLSGTISTSSTSLILGRAGIDYFKGVIDEVRIYSRALSEAEIQENFQNSPDFSSKLLAKIPKGTTQVIVTASWQGQGSLSATVESPSSTYTESTNPVYQKTTYSTVEGGTTMLNIKRLSVSVSALLFDEIWDISLSLSDVEEYSITVEVQK